MQNLTNGVNADLEEAGERFRVTARSIGAALTSMGFTSRKRTNRGWLLWLDRPARKHIHELIETYGIDSKTGLLVSENSECDVCSETTDTEEPEVTS